MQKCISRFWLSALIIAGMIQGLPLALAAPEHSGKPAVGYSEDPTPQPTPKEPDATITGQFTDDAVLDGTVAKIRAEAGPCASVTRAEFVSPSEVSIVCDEGQRAYRLEKRGNEWRFALPSGRGRLGQ